MDKRKFSTVDEYVISFSGETKKRMTTIRKKVFQMLPNASERISYNIPGFFLGDRLIIYIAGYETHVSIYPGRTFSDAYTKLSAKYASGKSTLKFPNNEPLPMDLIEQFIKLRIEETA